MTERHSDYDDGIFSFACVDLNELWAAAVPFTLEEEAIHETILAPTTGESSATAEKEEPTTKLEESDEEMALQETNPVAEKDMEDHQQEALHSNVVDVPCTAKAKRTKHETEKVTPVGNFDKFFEFAKYLYSAVILAFSIAMVTAAIFNKQTTATADTNTHPIIAFIVFWFLILWLALMEGGLNCMVGLKPIDHQLYAESHPRAHMCAKAAHKGDNLERFIVGRQFLDLTCVFLTSFMVSSIDGASVLGMPAIVNEIFLGAGVAVILVTIVIGQLVSQINAAHCMLDHINNYAMVASTYAALFLENSGLLHATYLVQITVAKIAGQKIDSVEGVRKLSQKGWFWTRVALSTCLLCFSLAVTIKALFDGNTTMWSNVPAPASVALLVILILVVGNMEGLQIAMIAVVHLPQEELRKHRVAHNNCKLTFHGSNLQAFLVGRQIFQTILMFIIARIMTLDVGEDDENVFGVSDGLQQFFNTGLLGALVSTIVASLSWRILASCFPLAFLSSPFAILTIRFCLLVENSGICSVAWLMAAVHKKLARLRSDEHYIGTAADRSAEKILGCIEDGCTASDTSQ